MLGFCFILFLLCFSGAVSSLFLFCYVGFLFFLFFSCFFFRLFLILSCFFLFFLVFSGWDDITWDTSGLLPWDGSSLDATEQSQFIRAGGNSNFYLYNTTYATPGYATPQSGTTGYFSEE